jgi:ribosome-binding factor A
MERFNEQLKREITVLIREEVRDPRVGMATVTGVEVSADLSVARVYISVVGDDAAKGESLEGLRAAAPFIRTELGRLLRVRRIPELRFELDRSLEYAMKIERLLHEALPERKPSEPPPEEDGSYSDEE